MANTRAAQMTKLNAGTTPAPGFVDGTVRCFNETVTYASQGIADTIEVGRLPKGAVVRGIQLCADTSSGTATISVGTSASPAKYRAAAVFTATDTPTLFGKAAALNVALAAEETVILTVGTAALPASGTLQVNLIYSFN